MKRQMASRRWSIQRAALDGSPYRVAVIDAQMVGMDGETLAGRIGTDPEISRTRLVMMTALGQRSPVDDVARTVVKPVRRSSLYAALSAACGLESESRGSRTLSSTVTASPGRILVVEDNPVNQLVAVRMLEKLGHHADVAANGKEALDALRTIPYDLVFMDCQMPEMDGFEAAQRIRQGEAGQTRVGIPIIAMTARAMQGDREACLSSGMNDYVTKPVDPVVLSEVLGTWLGRGTPSSITARKEPIQRKKIDPHAFLEGGYVSPLAGFEKAKRSTDNDRDKSGHRA